MSERHFTILENEWITLSDGTRLAARIWMPERVGEEKLPAVLEYLPYRKRGGTSVRDEATYPAFAAAGIAGVRVDIRGSGESDGVIDGEYTPRELSDGCQIIAWIAAQPWCNGSVGMMGISWGGFNCLQIAALKPAALKAVISIASTVDRYNDDIHYKNGCHLSAQLSWAATMLGYQSRPPDPALAGERWRSMWMERLENEPFFLEEWLEHQRKDSFWQHGSIGENFSDVQIPALVIAGWADGYRNTPLKAAEGLGANAWALIGPWVHKYPHFAYPKPRADFLGEAIAWWNRWLRGEQNGAEATPHIRAFILDSPKPLLRRETDPGFWVGYETWRQPQTRLFSIDAAGTLVQKESGAGIGTVSLQSPLDTGVAAGEWFTLKPDAEMAGDQRIDDAGSLTFETMPLPEAEVYLGQPVLTLTVSCDAPWANLAARLVDVHPDGQATRICVGVLNLAHRSSNANPQPLQKGQKTNITLVLDACGYRLRSGHRLRLALSTAYWPMILPPPTDTAVMIDTASLSLSMPLAGDYRAIEVAEPENPDPLPVYKMLEPAETRRWIERDLINATTHYHIYEDTGLAEHPDNHLRSQTIRAEKWSIQNNDPLSMTGVSTWTCIEQREGWSVRTVSTSRLACTHSDWLTSAEIKAYEGDELVFEKKYNKSIVRDFM